MTRSGVVVRDNKNGSVASGYKTSGGVLYIRTSVLPVVVFRITFLLVEYTLIRLGPVLW
jgi:hypothetical protein